MTIETTGNLSYRPISAGDSHTFQKLSRKKKYRSLVGIGDKENRDMAYAYSVNNRDYPLATIIETVDGSVAGILVLENAGDGALELSLVTEKAPDFYDTLFNIVEICQEQMVPVLYVSNFPGSPTDEYVKRTIESHHKTVKVVSIGTKESPEYKLVL